MAEEKKKADPNAYSDYGKAMASVKEDPMAVEWQAANEARIAALTTPKALADHVWDADSAAALLRRLRGAYDTDAMDMTVIAAVSQYVMEPMIGRENGCQKRCSTPGAAPCQRKIWNLALIDAFKKTSDAYIQTFLLDQLRWSGCKCRAKEIRDLEACAANAEVKKYIAWTASEVDGSATVLK